MSVKVPGFWKPKYCTYVPVQEAYVDKIRGMNIICFALLCHWVYFYVPSCQLAKYFFCSAVSVSIESPIERS